MESHREQIRNHEVGLVQRVDPTPPLLDASRVVRKRGSAPSPSFVKGNERRVWARACNVDHVGRLRRFGGCWRGARRTAASRRRP